MEGQLWSVALLLARLLGEQAVAATAAAVAQQSVAEAAPLHTLLLLLGGAPADKSLAAAAAASAQAAASTAAGAAGAASWGQPAMFNPAAGASSSGSEAWRRHLAAILGNRTPGDEGAVLHLGTQLLAAGQLLPAHICFVAAGALLQAWDVAAAGAVAGSPTPPLPGAPKAPAAGVPLVLLGADAAAQPRSCAQLQHILATEVFTWSRTVGERARGRGLGRGWWGRGWGALEVDVHCGTTTLSSTAPWPSLPPASPLCCSQHGALRPVPARRPLQAAARRRAGGAGPGAGRRRLLPGHGAHAAGGGLFD